MAHNEYTRRYALKLTSITWSRDSHGLFDFETRQLERERHITGIAVNFVRKAEKCFFVDPESDIRKDFNNKAQLLLQVIQKRNLYVLRSPLYYMLKKSISE